MSSMVTHSLCNTAEEASSASGVCVQVHIRQGVVRLAGFELTERAVCQQQAECSSISSNLQAVLEVHQWCV